MNEDKASEKDVAEVAARAGRAFERLVHTMATLRAPGGCPWDAEQTHQSLIRYLIEESYEVVEAVEAPEGTNRHPRVQTCSFYAKSWAMFCFRFSSTPILRRQNRAALRSSR